MSSRRSVSNEGNNIEHFLINAPVHKAIIMQKHTRQSMSMENLEKRPKTRSQAGKAV